MNIASALSVGSAGQILLAWTGVSRIKFAGAPYSPAACLSPSVLNSATFLQDRNIVPGELVSLTGLGIGPDTASTANVQVLFDGQPAPVLYAQSRQINTQAPVELTGKAQTTITVVFDNATVGTATATVDNYGAPGIFRLRPGFSADSAVINQDGTINGPQNPALKGSVIAMWGVGFGMITPPCSTGGLNPNAAVNLSLPLLVWFTDPGSPPTQPYAYPTYAGAAPGLLCGIVQINRVVPDYATSGAYTFTVLSLRQRPQGDAEGAFDSIPVKIYVK